MIISLQRRIIFGLLLIAPFAQAANSTIGIILGSTREGRFSDKLSTALEKIARKKGVTVEIIDLRDYELPFLDEETLPAKRTKFRNKAVKSWSEKISSFGSFIILCPEYNAGYPGVLKNALDALYHEWSNKLVGLISYSSGPYAGAGALAQLKQVLERLQMNVVSTIMSIPVIGQAFTNSGELADAEMAKKFEQMLDQLTSKK